MGIRALECAALPFASEFLSLLDTEFLSFPTSCFLYSASQIGIRALKCAALPFASVLDTEDLEAAEAEVEGRIKAAYKALVGRATKEVEFLPFPT